MTTALLLFSASFFFIFLRAFQQLNVVHDKFWAILPTSMLMAACDFAVIGLIAANYTNPWLIVPLGLGAGLGCMVSMVCHRKFLRKETTDES